jgi:uncharacterized phage protein (TIGR01671 family)
MEREIKFRLWHIEDKQMYSYDFMWGRSGQSGSGWVDCVPFGEEREVGFFKHGNQIGIDPHDCEIMQYTGKKDKNGIEIYEGDEIQDDGGYIGSVYWNQDHCQFLVDFAGLEDQELGEWAEVVGNIYESNNAVE